MVIPDEILVREAAFVYERAYGFEPIDGDLKRWRGFVRMITQTGTAMVALEIVLLENFPSVPPIVYVKTPISHPNVENGILSMRMLARWRPNYHLFQVMVETQRLFSKVRGRVIVKTSIRQQIQPKQQLAPLLSQRDHLATLVEQKEKELRDIKSKKNRNLSEQTIEQEKHKKLDDEILEIENKLFAIENQFEDYDISSIEFAKKYHKLKKRLYLLQLPS